MSRRWGDGQQYKNVLYLIPRKEINSKLLGENMGKFFVLLISVPLIIVAIVCTLFADRIDTVVKGDKKVKKVIIVFGVGVFLICTLAIGVSILA